MKGDVTMEGEEDGRIGRWWKAEDWGGWKDEKVEDGRR